MNWLALAWLVGLQAPGSLSTAFWTSEEVDELIERLPEVGCEARHVQGQGWVLEPDVVAMKELVESRRLTGAQWERALLHTGAIRWRNRWPADEPFAISVRVPAWLELGRIGVRPQWSNWQS